MDIVIFIIANIIKIFLFGLMFFDLIINFQSCRGWSLCFLSTKPVPWELSRGVFKCRKCIDMLVYCSNRSHPPFLKLHSLPSHHCAPYTVVAPIFYLFHSFSILAQELSFNYDSSSSFLYLNMKTISYIMYLQIMYIFF